MHRESENELRQALDRAVLDSLLPVSLVLVLLFALFVAFDSFGMPPEARAVVVTHDAVLGLFFLGVYFLLRRGKIPTRWGNALGAALAILTCSNNFVTLGMSGSVIYTPMLMIIMVGTGALLISMPWLLLSLAACTLGWLAVAWLITGLDELLLYSIFMIVAFAASVGLQVGRQRTQRRLHQALAEARGARQGAEELARLAEAANRTKGEFLANMSHEIRTPIHGVLGMAEIIKAEAPAGQIQDRVEIIHASARALLELVNDVLDFSKVEAGQLSLEQRVFRPRELLGEVSRLLEPMARDKGLAWQVTVDDALPEHMAGDPGRLRQILLNLMGNAVKFTEKGEVRTSLTLAGRGPGKRLELKMAVDDSGPGVEPELRQQLFEPFYQQDSSLRRQQGGSGLGLAIVRQLVRLMGGRIGVEDSPLGGACFWCTLELLAAEATDGAETVELAPAIEGRILVVDDHKINQQVAQAVLERFGLQVSTADSGPEALGLLAAESFDLVLLDVQMPGMDGLEVLERIRSGAGEIRNPQVPVLAVTAHAAEGDRHAFLEAGMDGFVGKPFDVRQLASLVAEHLERE